MAKLSANLSAAPQRRSWNAGSKLAARVQPHQRDDPAVQAAAAVEAFPRQALHAAVLGFKHPITSEQLRFEAPLPEDMLSLIAILRQLS